MGCGGIFGGFVGNYLGHVLEAVEWIFRGFLWYTLSNVFNEKIVLFLVSIIFAACHLDPTLVIGLLPISFFLGWLRKTTGGVKQSILAHIAHNATGALITVL